MNDDLPESDVYCRHCGTKMMIRRALCCTTYNVTTGEKEDPGIYVFECPHYIPIFGIFNFHQKFKSEWQFRHSSWN